MGLQLTPVTALLALIISALRAIPAAAQHPNLSGTWVLDRARSSLEYPKLADLDSAVVMIKQTDARFTVRYRLLDDGRMFQAQERFRAPRLRYDNLWVFVRRPGS